MSAFAEVEKDVEAEVMAAMQEHIAAMTAKNKAEGKDKEKSEDKKKGSDGEYDLSAAKVTVDGDIATITPVTFASSKGSISHKHELKKEADGVWRVVNSECFAAPRRWRVTLRR